ncbi:MAG: hypothetical protein IT226_05400 [Flavobacteriales bacterium]|nr:hypothetical protein [Flavobacteriales bacterium]
MKKTIIIAALTILTSAAYAQDKEKPQRTPAERAQIRTERMTKDLGLTPEQITKVEAINRKYAEQAEGMRTARDQEAGPARKAAQEKRKAMRDAHEAEMKAVLSTEQFATWKKQQEEMKAKHMDGRSGKGPRGNGRPAKSEQ